MGDYVGVQLPVTEIYLGLTSHPGQLSLAIPPWVSGMSIGHYYTVSGKKEATLFSTTALAFLGRFL